MVLTLENQEKFFRVSISNQEAIVISSSFEEAAASGLTSILQKFKEDTNLSPLLIVDKLLDSSFETEIFYTTRVLENLGHFSLAKKLEEVSDFLLDKGGNHP